MVRGCVSVRCIYDGGMKNEVDIAIIGGGAGGLSTAIWAGRKLKGVSENRSVVIFDGRSVWGLRYWWRVVAVVM